MAGAQLPRGGAKIPSVSTGVVDTRQGHESEVGWSSRLLAGWIKPGGEGLVAKNSRELW